MAGRPGWLRPPLPASRHRGGDGGPHLDDPFCGEDVGFHLGQVHETEVQDAVRLGPRHLQLPHGPAQHPFQPVIVALQLGRLNLVQQHCWRDWPGGRPVRQAAPSEIAPRGPQARGCLGRPPESCPRARAKAAGRGGSRAAQGRGRLTPGVSRPRRGHAGAHQALPEPSHCAAPTWPL